MRWRLPTSQCWWHSPGRSLVSRAAKLWIAGSSRSCSWGQQQAPGQDAMRTPRRSSWFPKLGAWLWATRLQNLKIQRLIESINPNVNLKKKKNPFSKVTQADTGMLQENTLTSDALEHQSSPVRLVRPHFPKSGVGGFRDNRTRKSRAYPSLNTSFVIFFSHCVLTPNSLNSTHIIHIKETSQDR